MVSLLMEYRVAEPDRFRQVRRGGGSYPVGVPEDVEQWATGRLLSTAARMVEHEWNSHLGRWGLNHAGFAVLHVLCAGPMAQRDLAAAVQVEDQTLSRTVERLERDAFVSRQRDPQDRRRLLVTLTDAGRAALVQATDPQAAEDMVRDSGADIEALREALVSVVRHHARRRWPQDGSEPRA